jgi:DNA-directed RNA polymerase
LPTPAQIDEQISLEREQIRQGLKELRTNTYKLEEKSYASASIYGVLSIDQLLPFVVARIQETNGRIRQRHVGHAFKEIIHYLADIEPEAAAAISLKVTFDKVFSVKPGQSTITNVAAAIGQAVENECMMRHYERNVPGLLNVLKENYFHRSIGTTQKVTVIKTLMKRYNVDLWKGWNQTNKVRLGSWLLDAICEVSNYFMKTTRRQGRKTILELNPTPEFLSVKDKIMAQAELFSPLAWPMLIEPNDWTSDGKHGGYILNEVMRGYDMVRRGKPYLIQGEQPVEFLNRIQKVAFTLNPFIVGVARTLQERQIQVGKFIPIVEIPLPPKPPDIADNAEARQDYRRRAAEVCNVNAQAFKKSCRTRMTMNAVERFKDVDKFFIPWSFDYRGRAYPIPAFLTPQDTDFGKSLLKFHNQAFMTPEAEQWLSFQCATTYGLDKASMPERMTWTLENQDLIKRIAEDPIGNLSEWEGADEPWTFLAACDEYYHCVIKCDRNYTNSCIAVDATCSGLQILAGLSRDLSCARLVNVLPSDRPQDAYEVIADEAKPHVPVHLQPYMDRKTTKRTVMTVPYNAKPFSNRGYIREALKEKGIEVEKEDLTAVVKAVRDAMNVIVPGPMRVMKWIESEVAAAIDRGATELSWVTPSGFVVTQKLMKKNVKIVELQLLGRCQITVADGDTNTVDKKHHKNATAPNLIHSLDASLLHLSATRFNAPISLIHDSVLCRATDMSVLSAVVRQTYMHLFAEHDYLTDWASQIGAETKPPIIDTLKPESVIESTYFFC